MTGSRRSPSPELHPAFAALALAVLTLGLLACSSGPPQMAPTAAPGFTLPRVDGGTASLADHQGKVVLLDFWATWCPPCRAAMPHLAEMQEEYRAKGLVVLGMNMDQNRDDLTQFLSGQTVNYPMLAVDEATRAAYGGVASIPQTFLIDRAGQVRQKFLGYDHKIAAQMEEAVQKLLREKP